MASSTPNINLTLPVGSENVSRQIINENNTKIDTAIGAVPPGNDLQSQVTTLNNKFPTKVDKTNMTDGESYKYTSQSAMESGLVSLATTVMGANKVRTIFLYPNFTSLIFGGAAGCATIATGGSSSYFTVLFHNYVTTVHGMYLNGTWSWQELALKSEIAIQRQNGTMNGTYLSEGTAVCLKIGELLCVQLYDVKFKQAISTSSENNNIALFTLPFNASLSNVVFTLTPFNPNDNVVRLRIQGNKITPWWSAIQISAGEGYYGSVVTNIV